MSLSLDSSRLEYACGPLCYVSLTLVFASILTSLKKEDTGSTKAIHLTSSSSCDSTVEHSSESDYSSNTFSSEEDKKKRKKKRKEKKFKKSKIQSHSLLSEHLSVIEWNEWLANKH